MMQSTQQTIKQYAIDAFSNQVFSGNPAAVCLLDSPLADEVMFNKELWLGRDLVYVLENEVQVSECVPNLDKMQELDGLLCHITAQGKDYDIVSRSFAPKLGVNEDPVCGSGHCHLFPY